MKVLEADFTLFRAHAKLDKMFPRHQVEAYEAIMGQIADKSSVEVILAKAYLTYASSQSIEGFEGSTQAWKQAFKEMTAECLQQQEVAINKGGIE